MDIIKNIKIGHIQIDDSEILRYLGYNGQEMTDKLRLDISRCRETIVRVAMPRFVLARFELEKTEDGIIPVSSGLVFHGRDIAELLAASDSCVLIAATLGSGVEKAINYCQATSISDAVIMDAAATAAIEAVCDDIESQLRDIIPVTHRYSCGYGDLPLDIQPGFLRALNAQKTIGLFCNSANIMIPRKSVTAVMGISQDAKKPPCEDCGSCKFNQSCVLKRTGGIGCGNLRIR